MCDLYICRICLNTAVRGYKLDEHNLCKYYDSVMGAKLNPKDVLPRWLCYECVMMLYKFHKFKEKCFRGQCLLQRISLRENISYESVAMINRYRENLTSSVEIVRSTNRVKTITVICKQRKRNIEITFDKNHLKNKTHDFGKISKQNSRICNIFENVKKTSKIDNIVVDTKTTNVDIENSDDDISHTNHIDHSMTSDDEITCDEDIIKHENTPEEVILLPLTQHSTDPIKSEISNSIDINKHLSNITDINNLNAINDREKTTNHKKNANKVFESTKKDLDINFDDDINDKKSDDDESLFDISKKRGKVKCKTVNRNKKPAPKGKKKIAENDKEIVLKNTKPLKLVLNPQFWKKINLSEEEAVREFRQREFNNDYYLKAKYKCQDCFKGFSKNEMLDRHLKQRHDESCGDMECRFCHMRFRHKHQLVKHIKEHLIVYNCLLCKLQCSRLSTAITHQEHHKGTKKTCKHCGKEFNHLSTYYTHVRMSHRSAHVCVACGASFVSEHGLLLHTKFMHIDNLKQLEDEIRKRRETSNKAETTANETSIAQPSIVEASQSAPDTEQMYCAKCDIKFMSRRAYNMHFFKSDNHDDGDASSAAVNLSGPGSNSRAKIPTTCPHCNKEFPTRVAYKKHHLAEHSHIPLNIPKKRDICEVCGASVQMGSIQYHMKSHTGEREFACPAPQCGMSFTLKRNMKRHYNVKHLGMPSPKYIRRNPGKRKKKSQEILENDFSPFVRTRTGYFL